jgi:hypothetical protein
MARTTRYDNGFNKGRDDKPPGAKHSATTAHPKGYDTFGDDHGHYGAGGSRSCKRAASRARRVYGRRVLRAEVREAV